MGHALIKLRFKLFILGIQFVIISSSFAHPVSYQGANSIMTWNSEKSTD